MRGLVVHDAGGLGSFDALMQVENLLRRERQLMVYGDVLIRLSILYHIKICQERQVLNASYHQGPRKQREKVTLWKGERCNSVGATGRPVQ
jgi:hypothetical protein